MLDIPFEDFLLASQAQTNTRNLSILELFRAQQRLSLYGFIPQTFRLELLNSIMDPFLFLVLGIVVLTLSWRLRPRIKPGFVVFPMFIMLPLVSHLVLEGSRILETIIYAALLLNFSMGATLAIGILKELLLLFIAILFLAGQRS